MQIRSTLDEIGLLAGLCLVGVPALVLLIKSIIKKKASMMVICGLVLAGVIARAQAASEEMSKAFVYLFSNIPSAIAFVLLFTGLGLLVARKFKIRERK